MSEITIRREGWELTIRFGRHHHHKERDLDTMQSKTIRDNQEFDMGPVRGGDANGAPLVGPDGGSVLPAAPVSFSSDDSSRLTIKLSVDDPNFATAIAVKGSGDGSANITIDDGLGHPETISVSISAAPPPPPTEGSLIVALSDARDQA